MHFPFCVSKIYHSCMRQDYQEKYYKPLSPEVVKTTVNQILSVAETKLHKKRSLLRILDVGSGHGEYTIEFAKYVKMVVGVEPCLDAYKVSLKLPKNKNMFFHNKLVEEFRSSEKFDLIVSLTTLEHMPNAEKSFQRIYTLLDKNSIVYLTAPNKLWPYDHHYRLPFITWLPLWLADFYLRIFGRGNSYKDCSYSKTYFGLISFLSKFDWSFEFLLPSASAPYLGCGERSSWLYTLIKKLGILLIKTNSFFWIFSKGFIVVVQKKD